MTMAELTEKQSKAKRPESKRPQDRSRAWTAVAVVLGVILVFFFFQYLQFHRSVRRVGRTLTEYLADYPPAVDTLLALSLETEQMYADARRAYHRAIAGAAGDERLKLLLEDSVGANATEQWAVFTKANQLALQENPGDPTLNLRQGLINAREKNSEEARARFEFFLTHAPADDPVRIAVERAFRGGPSSAEEAEAPADSQEPAQSTQASSAPAAPENQPSA